jgi:thiamine-phosphate pyrophosphorylase
MTELYAILDPEHCAGRSALWVAERILSERPAALQLRAKDMADAAHLELARALKELCREAAVPFWLNDRLDLALLVDADGLHLGQDDIPLSEARRLWGQRPLGLSTHSLAQIEAAEQQGADVLGFGPVFATGSKLNPDPVVGLEGLRAALAMAHRPLIAIGGIRLEHAEALAKTRVQQVAVISALCGADDPAHATATLKARLEAS